MEYASPKKAARAAVLPESSPNEGLDIRAVSRVMDKGGAGHVKTVHKQAGREQSGFGRGRVRVNGRQKKQEKRVGIDSAKPRKKLLGNVSNDRAANKVGEIVLPFTTKWARAASPTNPSNCGPSVG